MSSDDVQRLFDRMDAGFGKVHDKIDSLKDDFGKHQIGCLKHFVDLESVVMENKRRHDVLEKNEAVQRDWWKWIVRGASSVMAMASAAMLWKLLTGGAKIIIGE